MLDDVDKMAAILAVIDKIPEHNAIADQVIAENSQLYYFEVFYLIIERIWDRTRQIMKKMDKLMADDPELEKECRQEVQDMRITFNYVDGLFERHIKKN